MAAEYANIQGDKPEAVAGRRFPARLLLPAALLCGACFGRWDGFTLLSWWRDCHSGVVRWQAEANAAPEDASSADAAKRTPPPVANNPDGVKPNGVKPGGNNPNDPEPEGDKAGAAKRVALTFDDGPDPRYTPAVLDVLQRYHIHATFFVEGRFVRAHPELARRLRAEGHVIGNHTDTHPYLNRFAPPAVEGEITACDRTLRDTLGLRTYLLRPPRGLWNPIIYAAAQTRHDHIILWTVALEHHDAPTSPAMADRALRLIRPGGILLLHDGGSAPRDTTVAALPLLLDGLRARGYRCVTIPELLHIRGNEKTD